MADYGYLIKYKIPYENGTDKKLKHNFFKVTSTDVINCESKVGFILPSDLEEFYKKIGYGFMHTDDEFSLYQLLEPDTIADIYNKEDIYGNDPDMEIYDNPDKIVFFKLNEGVYLTINRIKKNGFFEIQYFDKVIANSIEEFMEKFDKNPLFFED